MRYLPGLARAAALSLALMVTACATTGGQILPTSLPTVTDVQAAAVKVCSFLPTAETITSILGLNDPALASVTSIADAICNAINSRSARAGAAPYVKGVRIKGRFAR